MKHSHLTIAAVSLALLGLVGCGGESPYRNQAFGSRSIPDSVFIIVDTSGSMEEQVTSLSGRLERKIDIASRSISTLTSQIPRSSAMGLWQYPDPWGYSCNDGLSLVDLSTGANDQVTNATRGLEAWGDTPTAEALEAAAASIRNQSGTTAVILISDGLSNCGDPCDVVQRLSSSVDWRITTIGFDLGVSGSSELRCMADASGGSYLNASDGAELETIFSDATTLFSVSG